MDYLKDFDRLILKGDFKEVLNRIDNILRDVELTDKEDIALNLLKCKAFFGLGEFKTGYQISQDMLKLSRELKYTQLELDALIVNISHLFLLGKFDEILKHVYLGEQLICTLDISLKEVIEKKGEIALQKGMITKERGNYKDSLEIFRETLNLFKEIENSKKIAETLGLLAKTYNDIGESETALDYFQQALEIQEQIEDKPGTANTLKELGTYYLFRGERDRALDLYQKSYDLNQKIGNIDLFGRLWNNIGIVHVFNGDIKEGEACYEKAQVYQKKIGHKGAIARTFNNIGVLNIKMGNLEKAEENIRASLTTFQEIGNVQNIMNSFNQLGRIYQLRGQFEEALLNFQLAINMMDQISSQNFNSLTLYYYIKVSILNNDLEQAKEKLELLKQIELNSEEPLIRMRMILATALLLKTSDQARNRGKAEEYFEEVIANELVESDMKIVAMLNLCELYITELKETNNKELLEEVRALANNILEIAGKQHSMLLYAESYWLISQIALVELNIRLAREYLTMAQNIAQDWGIELLAQKISSSHDRLLERLEIWENLSQSNAEIPEIIETAELEEFFRKLYLQKELDIQFLPEEPIMFLLLKSSGAPIYSKNFILNEELDDSLVSGFLSAIRIFAKETFSSESLIDRIKHNDYTIIINNFESYLVCYVFKGQSFSALQKLTQLMDKIKLEESVWNELKGLYDSTQPLSKTGQNMLDTIVSRLLISSI